MTPQIESGLGCAIAKPADPSTNTQTISCSNTSPETPTSQTLEIDRPPGLSDRYLTQRHRDEWVKGSCVSLKITEANAFSLSEDEAVEFLLDGKKGDMRKSTGLYDHVRSGAWACCGVDPLNNFRPSTIGQLKPDNPRPKPGKPEKELRYESQLNVPSTTIYLDYPGIIDWRKVQADVSIPIVITEGVKKAGCVLTAGFVAIAVTGVENWSWKDDAGVRQLEPRLALFAKPGRIFTIAYDAETKPDTILGVGRAKSSLAKALIAQGCTVLDATWDPAEGKGLDDVGKAKGLDRVREILNNAQPFVPTDGPEGATDDDRQKTRATPVRIAHLVKKAHKLPPGDESISPDQLSAFTQAVLATWCELAEREQAIELEPRDEFNLAVARLESPLGEDAVDRLWATELGQARAARSVMQSAYREARLIKSSKDKGARLSTIAKARPTLFGNFLEDAIDREIKKAEKVTARATAKAAKSSGNDGSGFPKDLRESAADTAIRLFDEKGGVLFSTPAGSCYADITSDGIRRTLELDSPAFRDFLTLIFFDETSRSISADGAKQAIATLSARARFRGETRSVFTRTAELDGKIYLDLANDEWQVVEVDASGWRVIGDAPVRFRRPSGSLALPNPVAGGSMETFRKLLGLEGQNWVIAVIWLIQSIKPAAEYPALLFHGPPDAGKSSASEAFKMLLDPSSVPLLPSVGDVRNYAVTCANRHVVAIDNLSGLTADQSDILCRAATGGGFSHRTLHSDSGETTIAFLNPQILNGIGEVATRGDLLARIVAVSLLKPEKRLSRTEFKRSLSESCPQTLGALLDLLSKVIAILPSVAGLADQSGERFMEFVEIGLAVEKALHWAPGTVIQSLGAIRAEAHSAAIDSHPVGSAIRDLMEGTDEWCGTCGQLLERLAERTPDRIVRSQFWPSDATRLAKALPRITSDLAATGIDVVLGRRTKFGRPVRIERRTIDHELRQTAETDRNLASPVETPTSNGSQQLGSVTLGDAGDATSRPASPARTTVAAGSDVSGDASDAKNLQSRSETNSSLSVHRFDPEEDVEIDDWGDA